MAKRNRNTLKNFFKEGALPTEHQFADLIDSSLNVVDEGFEKSGKHGLELSLEGEGQSLISFFRKTQSSHPLWSMGLEPEQDNLQVQCNGIDSTSHRSVLTLSKQGQVGIGQKTPQADLDVGGVIKSQGRSGVESPALPPAYADGQWHDISEDLKGCQAFEIMAGVGQAEGGRCAIVHAIALQASAGPRLLSRLREGSTSIKTTQAFSQSRKDRLKLRWNPIEGGRNRRFRLQICTQTPYAPEVQIQYFLTRLWHDETMRACWTSANQSEEGKSA